MGGGNTECKKILRGSAAGAAALILLFSAPFPGSRAADVSELLPVGQAAPDFESVNLEGRPFTLQEALSAGPVFLVFWSVFCSVCQEELPVINEEQEEFADQKVQFITVNLDEAKLVRVIKNYVKQKGFTFQTVRNKTEEREYKIDQLYQVKGTPASYLIEPGGTILFSKYGAITPEEMHHAVEQLHGE